MNAPDLTKGKNTHLTFCSICNSDFNFNKDSIHEMFLSINLLILKCKCAGFLHSICSIKHIVHKAPFKIIACCLHKKNVNR